MDAANRVFIVGAALVWIFLVLVVVLLAWGAPENSIDALGDFVEYLDDHTDNLSRLILTLGGVILILLAVIVVIAEVTPPSTAAVKVGSVKAGSALITTQEIEARLQEELLTLTHVTEAAAKVIGRGRGVELDLHLHVDPESNLAETAEAACQRARELVAGRMGLALLQEPRAHLHYRELRLARPAGGGEESAAPGVGAVETGDEAEAQATEKDRPTPS